MIKNKNTLLPKVWKDSKNKPISCSEKIKILNENILEINRMMEDAIEDAELMGADSNQVINILKKSIDSTN
mgnify:CR=1 FL=1